MWEMAVLPMLLFNSECWLEIGKPAINTLEHLQYTFLRCILGVGSGCPLPLLLSETGMILMELRVLKKKLMFLHHLFNLEQGSLAKEILTAQVNLNLPGLFLECKDFLNYYKLSNVAEYSKGQWKRLINDKIRDLNKAKLVEMTKLKSYKKIDLCKLKEDDCTIKSFFLHLTSGDARMRFKFACQMTPTVAMNFQSNRKYWSGLWSCPNCENERSSSRDTQEHLLTCMAYADLRIDKDLNNDKDLVDYLNKVVNLRLQS